MKKFSPFLIVAFLLAAAFFYRGGHEEENFVSIGGENIKVELALTPEEQARGLSGRRSLPDGEGLLFVFPEPGRHQFWMKDMNFSIDIIWLGEDKKIIYIKENASPADFPNSYGPEADAKYVLEVNAGFSEETGLKVGEEVELTF